jgi:photosystem II stability/assembly factor-like uncharacterized protein
MEKKEGKRAWLCLLNILVPFSVLVLALAGCEQKSDNKVELNNDLIRRTDKFFDVAHVTGNVFVTVGYEGRILRSEDNGHTWQEITPRPVDASLNQVTFVEDYGWAVGHNGTIVHTRDGGKTWTPQQSGTTKTIFSVSFADKLHGWACGDESTWLWTDNGGETWKVERIEVSQVGLSEETSLAVPDIIYYGVHFIDAQTGWMVGEYGNIRHTSDGGKTWDSQHESLLDALAEKGGNKDVMTLGAFFRVRFTDKNHGVAVGAGGAMAATDDGGKKWHWVAREGDKADVPNLHLYNVVTPGQDGRLVTTGTNGLVLISTNGGADWKPAKIPGGVFTWINGIAFADSGKGVLVGGRGLILLSDDAGQSWQTLSGQKG